MNVRSVLSIGIRIFAVFLMAEAVYTAFSFLMYKEMARENLGLLAVPAVYVLVAFIAWKFPLTIAGKLIPKEVGTGEEKVSFTAFDLARVGVALLALNMIIEGAWSVLPVILTVSGTYGYEPFVLLPSVTMLVLGIVLLVNNGRVAYIVCK